MVVDGSLTVGSLASYCLYATNLSESMKDTADGVAGMIKAQGLSRKPESAHLSETSWPLL